MSALKKEIIFVDCSFFLRKYLKNLKIDVLKTHIFDRVNIQKPEAMSKSKSSKNFLFF
jgi:hypothetical protein